MSRLSFLFVLTALIAAACAQPSPYVSQDGRLTEAWAREWTAACVSRQAPGVQPARLRSTCECTAREMLTKMTADDVAATDALYAAEARGERAPAQLPAAVRVGAEIMARCVASPK